MCLCVCCVVCCVVWLFVCLFVCACVCSRRNTFNQLILKHDGDIDNRQTDRHIGLVFERSLARVHTGAVHVFVYYEW
jgi:hypothetical protein